MQPTEDQYVECIEFDWSFLKEMDNKQTQDCVPQFVDRVFNNLPFEVGVSLC
jgi:hypothetical protein